MALSKMGGRKDELVLDHLDLEQQAVESWLVHLQPAELRRPFRPFVVLTLDTVQFASWLLGLHAAEQVEQVESALLDPGYLEARGGVQKGEEGGATLSIPRSISCLMEKFCLDRLATLGVLLLGGAATCSGPLALASIGVHISPTVIHELSGFLLTFFGGLWLVEKRLEEVPRWFVRLCSANAFLAAAFHFGMLGLLSGGGQGLIVLPPEFVALCKSFLDSQLFAPYFAVSAVGFPLTVACMSSMAGASRLSEAPVIPFLSTTLATYCFIAPNPWEYVVWAGSVLLLGRWWFVQSKEFRKSERERLDMNFQTMRSPPVNVASHMFSAVWAGMAATQGLVLAGCHSTEVLRSLLAALHAAAVLVPARTLLRDAAHCTDVLTAPGIRLQRIALERDEPEIAG